MASTHDRIGSKWIRSGSIRRQQIADVDDLGLVLVRDLLVQPNARASEHLGETVERSGPQSQRHRADIEVDDLAGGAVLGQVAAIGDEQLD